MTDLNQHFDRLKAVGQRNVTPWVKDKKDLKPGDEIVGVVVETGTIETEYGTSPSVTLDVNPSDPKADFKRVMGFHGIIEDAIHNAQTGDLFYCRFLGREPASKEGYDDYYNYRVIVEPASARGTSDSESL